MHPAQIFQITLLSAIAAPSNADACTLCGSDIAEQVRHDVFGPGFLENLAALSAPLLILGAIVVFLAISERIFGAWRD